MRGDLVALTPEGRSRDQAVAASFADLHYRVAIWQTRLVPRRPRSVHRAAELASDVALHPLRDNVEWVIGRIADGEPINPHLSRQARKPPDLSTSSPAKPDNQLSDWGIHHLHLGQRVEGDGAYSRTGETLIVRFERDDAYVIGLGDHLRYADREFVRRVVRNWPEQNLFQALAEGTRPAVTFTDRELAHAQRRGVNVLFEIDGRTWVAGGQAVNGQPIAVRAQCNVLQADIRSWRTYIDSHGVDFDDAVAQRDGLDYGFAWADGRFSRVCRVALGDYFLGEVE